MLLSNFMSMLPVIFFLLIGLYIFPCHFGEDIKCLKVAAWFYLVPVQHKWQKKHTNIHIHYFNKDYFTTSSHLVPSLPSLLPKKKKR